VAIGGSITTGHQASPPEINGWAGRLDAWFKEKASEINASQTEASETAASETTFIKSEASVEFHNAGASGTDSAFGSIRVKDHVLAHNPDLVIIEFAVNDQWLGSIVRRRSYEGVIRQLMENSDRAIIILSLNEKGSQGKSTYKEQERLAKHYNIPVLSWADWVAAKEWNSFFTGSEVIHPNNEGHENIASGIIKFLENAMESPEGPQAVRKKLPSPLYSEEFQFVKLIGGNDSAAIISNSGWEPKPAILPAEWAGRGGAPLYGWTTSSPDASLSLRVNGKSVGVLFAESDQFRDSLVWLEDSDGNAISEKNIIKNFSNSRKGYYGFAYAEIADNLDLSKEYVLRLGVNPGEDKGSSTHIIGVICTGLRD
jgi:lysophospholipase L1-like esterase